MLVAYKKRHSIIIISVQIISTHLADLHLKVTMQAQRSNKQLKVRAILGRNRRNINTGTRTILSSH